MLKIQEFSIKIPRTNIHITQIQCSALRIAKSQHLKIYIFLYFLSLNTFQPVTFEEKIRKNKVDFKFYNREKKNSRASLDGFLQIFIPLYSTHIGLVQFLLPKLDTEERREFVIL